MFGSSIVLTEFDTNVFVRVGIPELFVRVRVRQHGEQHVLDDCKHVRLQKLPRVTVANTVGRKRCHLISRTRFVPVFTVTVADSLGAYDIISSTLTLMTFQTRGSDRDNIASAWIEPLTECDGDGLCGFG